MVFIIGAVDRAILTFYTFFVEQMEVNKKMNYIELRTKWIEWQSTDNDNSPSLDQFVCKNSFTDDGIIDNDAYLASDAKVLIVSKESNAFGKRPESTDLKLYHTFCANGGFWLSNILNDLETPDGYGVKYINGLAVICNGIMNNDFINPNTCWDNLRKCSYINLNKRGGFSKCSPSVLAKYVDKYSELIVEQIKLIHPTIIVCCGKLVFDLLQKNCGLQDDPRIKHVYHPSCRISYKERLCQLKKALNSKS